MATIESAAGAPARVRRLGAGLLWWGRGVLGGHAYQGYLAWHGRHGTGDPLSERDYWRHRSRHEDTHPEGRCC